MENPCLITIELKLKMCDSSRLTTLSKNVQSAVSILVSENPGFGDVSYTVTLAPGMVRYLSVDAFFKGDVDKIINEISRYSVSPIITPPNYSRHNYVYFEFPDLDKLIGAASWDVRLRVHHAVGCLVINHQTPSYVYCGFHSHLRLGVQFDVAECLNSWVEGTARNGDIARSYEASPKHIVFRVRTHFGEDYCVFKKTDFLVRRLDAIAKETTRKTEDAAQLAKKQSDIEEEQRALADLELLRKSRFDTYIYVMEDSRNGTFKLGRSKTPNKRERTSPSEAPEITLRLLVPAAEAHEKHLHRHFDQKRLRGEWFSLTPDDILWIVSFLKANGDIPRAFVDEKWLGNLYFNYTPTDQRLSDGKIPPTCDRPSS